MNTPLLKDLHVLVDVYQQDIHVTGVTSRESYAYANDWRGRGVCREPAVAQEADWADSHVVTDQLREKWLFHGTSYASASEIAMSGFDHRLRRRVHWNWDMGGCGYNPFAGRCCMEFSDSSAWSDDWGVR